MSFFHLPYPNPPRTGCEGEITLMNDLPVADSGSPWGAATYHAIEAGDETGHALHNLINSSPNNWFRCYQVELK